MKKLVSLVEWFCLEHPLPVLSGGLVAGMLGIYMLTGGILWLGVLLTLMYTGGLIWVYYRWLA